METIAIALVMIAAVIVSSWIVRMLPFPIPLPLLQIALGYAITAYGHLGIELNPHVFLFLFLPPLLFLDGWRIPNAGLAKDLGSITQLAFGLVFLTVVGIGYLIYWMIPGVPLPVAFAIGAVISPTDPVAVSAIAQKVPFPSRVMHILEGESLFNDASGLVCLKFAIAAAVAIDPTFSLSAATFEFVKMVIGGLGIGVFITWGVSRLKLFISRRWGEESGTQILVSLLIPFVAYMLAEQWHFSGVLAAVAAGITMSYTELRGQVMAVTRIRRDAVWDSLQMLANGTMFILLGEQLPKIVAHMDNTVKQAGHTNPLWLLLYVVVITAALVFLRWLWVWVSLKIKVWLGNKRGHDTLPIDTRLIAAMSMSGVRGSITMAGVLSIPLVTASGETFPARDLAIFLASGVTLVTLVLASTTLPFILNGLILPASIGLDKKEKEDRARIIAAQAAIKAAEQAQHDMSANSPDLDLYMEVVNHVIDNYRSRIEARQYLSTADAVTSAATVRKREDIEKRIRLAALAAERNSVFKQSKEKLIDETLMSKLVREIDLEEARYLV